MIRICLADDHAMFREGIKQILASHSDMQVVAEAGDGHTTLEVVRTTPLEVVLLDISMPGLGGLDILQDITRENPQVRVLVLTMHPEEQYAIRVLKAGAAGYLTKESAAEELVSAVRLVAKGGTYVGRQLAQTLAAAVRSDWDLLPHHLLSDREFQVMRMLALGSRVRDIAEELSLSEKTITTYRARVLEKMKLRTNVEITRYALRHRLIT
jgi:two-component system, NarL family, invasion response regulator UvrY